MGLIQFYRNRIYFIRLGKPDARKLGSCLERVLWELAKAFWRKWEGDEMARSPRLWVEMVSVRGKKAG